MNRIADALRALGGSGTTQDIRRVLPAPPPGISAQLAGMEKRGDVVRAGTRLIEVDRWSGKKVKINSIVWRLK